MSEAEGQQPSKRHLRLEDDDDEDDDIFDQLEALVAAGHIPGFAASAAGRGEELERKVRARNKDRDFGNAAQRFNRLYFSPSSVYSDADFERRFRMQRSVYQRVEEAIIGRGIFVQREYATGRPGIHPRTRILGALLVLAYGLSYDQVDELCEMGATTMRESFISFADEVVEQFGEEYLRSPNEDDLRRILAINEARGFPGCLRSWDCQHWQWKNCPVAWAGQFKGKEKNPTVVLEAIADGKLWIWGCNFGSPGSMNDINVLDSSSLVGKILDGRMMPEFKYTLNHTEGRLCCYLVDGIYPKWAIFIGTISEAISHKDKQFSSRQEAVRKDVERAFGVLVSRWHILKKPCHFWDRNLMGEVMRTAIILQNMIVEARRDGYDSELFVYAEQSVRRVNVLDEDGIEQEFKWCTRNNGSGVPSTDMAWARMLDSRDRRIMDEVAHFALKQDLVEHVWNTHGVE